MAVSIQRRPTMQKHAGKLPPNRRPAVSDQPQNDLRNERQELGYLVDEVGSGGFVVRTREQAAPASTRWLGLTRHRPPSIVRWLARWRFGRRRSTLPTSRLE